jgi:hypothetical protein
MPSYFPENNTPLPTDTVERSLHKAVSLMSSAVGGAEAPIPNDSTEILANKLVKSLNAAASMENSDAFDEAPEDGIIYGRKDADWVDITAPANLQIRRGTNAEVNAITPLVGEPVWKTDTKKLVVGDGVTLGGIATGKFPLDGTLRAGTSATPTAGSIFVVDEVENRGGLGSFRPHVAGNARGAGAVDFQMQRQFATQVATAPRSTIIGGERNTIESAAFRSVILGSNATTISSNGPSAAIICTDRIISGGLAFSVNSNISGHFGVGFHANVDRQNMLAHGNGNFVTGFGSEKRAQAIQVILKGRTTNNTPTPMAIDNVGPVYFTIPNNVALFGQVEVCAIEETTATEAVHYFRKFGIRNLGGTTTLMGSVTTIGTDYESNPNYDVSVTADNTSDSLQITVTGDTSKVLRWVVTIRGTEIQID